MKLCNVRPISIVVVVLVIVARFKEPTCWLPAPLNENPSLIGRQAPHKPIANELTDGRMDDAPYPFGLRRRYVKLEATSGDEIVTCAPIQEWMSRCIGEKKRESAGQRAPTC